MGLASHNEESLRNALAEVGRRLWTRGLVAAHDGNLSVRTGNSRILCTPSGLSKGFMTPPDMVVTDENGEKLYGPHAASSELKMHVEIYRRRPDVNAIVHAHPPHATACAVNGLAIPQHVMPEIDVLLGVVPQVAYQRPGTQKLAEAVATAAESADVMILCNHGATTCGSTLEEAWFRMESLDHCCRVLLLARQAGDWQEISADKR